MKQEVEGKSNFPEKVFDEVNSLEMQALFKDQLAVCVGTEEIC